MTRTKVFREAWRHLLLISGALVCASATTAEPDLSALSRNDDLHLVVTDSGLGGLSVVADIAKRARETKSYRNVDIIFANALFRPEAGYNSLSSREDKIAVFNKALESMQERYDPDAVLVACNTLSVLLPECPAANGEVPVVGIVDSGVEMIESELAKHPDATALLFATQTTVDEGGHRDGLLRRGIAEERFVVQACPNLTWYIEREPEGFDTELLISTFVSDALEKRTDKTGPVAISFNCTHFGYSQSLWEQELARQGVEVTATLNPNTIMAGPLFPDTNSGRFEETTVTVSAVSMVGIPETTVNSLSPVLAETSEETAKALENWKIVPDLFDWQSALEKR